MDIKINSFKFVIFKIAIIILSLISICGCENKKDAIQIPYETVTKKILDNGLTVLSKSNSLTNLVIINIKIKAGSSLEGKYLGSGMSHLLEHLVFDGTKTRPKGTIEKEVKAYGGIINGSTSTDITEYYIMLPSQYVTQGLEILKDMMLNASLTEDDIKREKDIITKEINMAMDDPQSRSFKIFDEAAYLEHPYKFPPIGYEANLRALTKEDIEKYYKQMYVPNKMVVTVVGGIGPDSAISMVEEKFKDFRPANFAPEVSTRAEPPQIQTRRIDNEMDINLAYMSIGFHSTSLLDKDLFAMDVLAMILGRGDNSRLSTKLFREMGIVYNITAWNHTPKDPGVFVIMAILDKANIDKTENAIMGEISKIKDGVITDAELRAAKRAIVSDYINSIETIDGEAKAISDSQIFTGTADFSARYINGIQSVTKDDVRSAAKKYLRADAMTVARVIPKNFSADKKSKEPKVSMEKLIRETLNNGITVIIRENKKTPTVAIVIAFPGGTSVETAGNNGISNLTAEMLLRGSINRGENRIKGRIQELGGDLTSFSGVDSFGLSANILKNDVNETMDILSDSILHPKFLQTEIDKVKSLVTAGIREEDDDIFQVGFDKVKKEIFDKSPYALRSSGEIDTVNAITREELLEFYNTYVSSDKMIIAISGDVDGKEIISEIKNYFSGMRKKPSSLNSLIDNSLNKIKVLSMAMSRDQSLFLIGFKTIGRNNPDKYPLEVLTAILSGTSGRLFDELRSKSSLAYTMNCSLNLWTNAGILLFSAATTKENLDQARDALLEMLWKIRDDKITEEELEMAKKELITAHEAARQSNMFYALNFALDHIRGIGCKDIYDYNEKIQNVTKEDVEKIAKKYIDPHASSEVIISQK